ncbi:MAG: GTP 3',8-cyclase MoaA [Parvularculaceae bacterium]|nr:GTP 3',8-cyclase MoaA [Parvularculaceae bacterium]
MIVATPRPLVDPYGRSVSYLRASVTDRCDLRCAYCMPERMKFQPRHDLLSLEELARLIRVFIGRGVRKVRLTGGEPLVRKGVMTLVERLGAEIGRGLDELTLTTNGVQLDEFAMPLAAAGIRRINVSLDTLDPATFEFLTRRPVLANVLNGIDAAAAAGIAIKINTVALKGTNDREIPAIISWAHARGFDISLIEVMPMGEIDDDRADQYLPLAELHAALRRRWTLEPIAYRTGGPSRYVRVAETGGRLGFITPLTNNFCEGCNRVRLTCTGRLYMCLGQNDAADFRDLMRQGADDAAIGAAIEEAIGRKPKGHDFEAAYRCGTASVARAMAVTGG